MKSSHKLLLAATAIVFSAGMSPARANSVVTITSLPYRVNASGEYQLDKDLTAASGDNGITIASGVNNVLINLNGHMMFGAGSSTGVICSNSTNVTIRNGVISGFSNGINFSGAEFFLNGLKVIVSNTGVALTGENCDVDGCIIVSSNATNVEPGVAMDCAESQVSNCQISGFNAGVLESGSDNAMIHNFLTNCGTGLSLASGDKYQGNVTARCGTPFSGGTAVGGENG
jgi:hypothetical protein